MALLCPKCLGTFDMAGGRLPPWCPHCGADVNKETLEASDPAAARQDRPASPSPGLAPPWMPGPVGQPDGIAAERFAVPAPALATGFDDGRPLAVYDFSTKGYLHTISPGIMMFAIFAALAAGGVALDLTRPNAKTALPALLMGGIGFAILAFSFAGYGKRIRRVEVFADGIRWHGPEGVLRLAWADVEAVYRSEIVFNGFPKSELKLVARNGREVTFDRTIDRYQEFMNLVQGRSADAIRPRKLAESGSCGAEFGPLLVGPAGISTDGWLVPWDAIERYYVRNGRLCIEFLGRGSKSIPLHGIPNYLVLLYLMGEFAPPAVRQASGVPAAAG